MHRIGSYLLLVFISFISAQRNIRIVIMDDLIDFKEAKIDIHVSNVSFCYQDDFVMDLYSIPLLNISIEQMESDLNQYDVFLIRRETIQTKFIRDYVEQTNRLFLSMDPSMLTSCLEPISAATRRWMLLDPFKLSAIYLKFYQVRKLVYIYDHRETSARLYRFLDYLNDDDYFRNFSLEVRTTNDDDIYSLLYSIESQTFNKYDVQRYILLDLQSYDEFEFLFNKLSHMGLTSDAYFYLITSTFDACLWLHKFNFNGRLIYFDTEENYCNQNLLFEPVPVREQPNYYRSTLSFRPDVKNVMVNHSSALSNNLTVPTKSRCSIHPRQNHQYVSLDDIKLKISAKSHFYSRLLTETLNSIVHTLAANIIDCKNFRVKIKKSKRTPCQMSDVNVFSMRKSPPQIGTRPIELIGQYSATENQYRSCKEERQPGNRFNLRLTEHKIYYITSLIDEPFLMLRRHNHTSSYGYSTEMDINEHGGQIFSIDQVEGYCVELAEKICSILNITCYFRIVEDGNFGSKNTSTGIWNGMVGDIVSRKADMAIAPLTISQKRMEVVEFSKPFMNLGISMMIRKPDVEKPGVFSFMHPVSMEVWFCLTLSYFAVSVVLFLTSRVVNSAWRRRVVRRPSYRSFSYPKSVSDRRKSEIELFRYRRDSNVSDQFLPVPTLSHGAVRHRSSPRIHSTSQMQSDKKPKTTVQHFGLSNALFFSFSSFMRQSINLVPKSLSGRVAATAWWYFSLIFVSSYTANLVAFLTVEKLVTPIERVEDLAKQDEIKYGVVRNGTTSDFFEKSNVTVFQHMWAVMQQTSSNVFVPTNDEGVRKVRSSKGKYAFIIESTKNEYVNERLPCDTMKVGSDLDSKGYGIATPIGSELTQALDIIVTNLRENGYLDKLKQRWWYERSECPKTAKDKRFSELSLSSVTGLFFIFLFGIILSCVIVLVEFIITAKVESKERDLTLREILRNKMIENMIGVTIHTQHQLESGSIYPILHENEILTERNDHRHQRSESDV